jgi:drug/metabolite transporter (DMT)-like permease
MLSALLALAGALVYGSGDFLGGLAARRLPSIVATSVAAASGLVILVVAYPFLGGAWLTADVWWGVLSGVFGVIALVLLYACLAIGPMSILSPLTAVVSAIAPMIWGLTLNGEKLSSAGYLGLGIALVAVVLVGFVPDQKAVRPSVRGIVMAIGAGLAIGAFIIVMDRTSTASGIVPLLANRTTNAALSAVLILGFALFERRRGRRLLASATRAAWWWAIGCGVLDASANVLMLVALRLGDLSVVSALIALYPAGTILLASIVLRERVAVVQWIGLALALTAGGLLALA